MKPGDVAKILGIGRSTVSLWTSGEYREYFTAGAQGGRGNIRNLTDIDVQVLHLIDALKKSGSNPDDIHATLRQLQKNNWADLPPLPNAPAGIVSVPVVPQAAADGVLTAERRGYMREIATLQEKIDQLENKLDTANTDRERLLRELAAAERELELYRSGRLKPE
jgi:DNA-binding transcriptional MerR regulator